MQSQDELQKTVDVKLFFRKITEGYAELTEIIDHFSMNLPSYSPEQIISECNKIQDKREKLSLLDQELHSIVQIVNTEIQHENFVNDYRRAFNKAIAACDSLHTNLLITKAELLSPNPSGKPN